MTDENGTAESDLQLYLFRHAHAGDSEAWAGPDEERPLSDKGRRQAERMSSFLKASGFRAEALLSSPKKRAADTARICGKRVGLKVRLDDRLGGEVTISAVERILSEAGDPKSAVLVGHDPDFSALVALLCGASRVPLKKGAVVRIDAARPLRPGGGVLRWLVTPDLLRGG